MDDKESKPEHHPTDDLRVAQEEAGHPTPCELTLADVAVTWRVGTLSERYTGAEIAQLIDALSTRHDEHEAYTDNRGIVLDLMGLAHVQAALSHVVHEGEFECSDALHWVSQQMHRLSQRVMALEPTGNRKADWYKVEITKRLRPA